MMMGSVGVQAAVSSATDIIEGRVPTAEGTLFVADQTGATVGTTPENSIVDRDHTPNSFKASTDTTDLTLLDVDGDCDLPRGPCTAAVDVAGTTKVWKYNGNLLTAVMLGSSFKTYFAGKSLTVTVTAPVATTTTTGAPIVGTNPLSSEETTVVVPVVPGIYVGPYPGTYRWEVDKKFPTTAALGLTFTIYLADGDGIAQTDFNWTSNQTWAKVGADGLVTFTAAPTSATKTVTITATNKTNPLIKTLYTFTVNKWFETVRIAKSSSPNIATLCSIKGVGYRNAGYSEARGPGPSATFRQVPGALVAEWGVGQQPSGWNAMSNSALNEDINRAWAVIDSLSSGSDFDAVPTVGVSVSPVPWAQDVIWPGNPDGYRAVGFMSLVNTRANLDFVCVKDL
ncbi:hypothetical protein [Budvicia aquatica]|uniref:hypothetical protein n=1 Tax=Budvicia aquatica TaxID=82979 RepID=UPI00141B7434|nr:hypothetical protein [Budvicia aquatica]